MTRAVIWDVDGTLLDTAEEHFRAWVRLAAELDKPFTRADFAATFGRRNPEIIRGLFHLQATDADCLALGQRKEEFYREAIARTGVALLPGAEALLKLFDRAGWPQAVGSSAPRENLDLLFERVQVTSYFRTIVAGEDVSHGKPHPEVFLLAAQRLQVAPENCVVLEDAEVGVEAAKRAGMTAIAVRFVGHHSATKLRDAGADRIVESLEELTIDNVQQLLPESR